MNFNNVEFEAAAGLSAQLPESSVPEICFAGRSNVGKSSLINRVLGRKAFARVSSRPGKTVTVNFYRLDGLRIVDLPGYGFARVSFSERTRWSELMEGYFQSGRNIKTVFLLIDMRHPPTADDIDMLNFLKSAGLPYTVVLTKSDKLNKSEYAARIAELSADKNFRETELVPFSALNGEGTERLRNIISDCLDCSDLDP